MKCSFPRKKKNRANYCDLMNGQEEIRNVPSNLLMNQPNPNESMMPVRGGMDDLPKPPAANRREIILIS